MSTDESIQAQLSTITAQLSEMTAVVAQLKSPTHIENDKPLVYKKPRSRYIVPTDHLLSIYPAIKFQKDFFKAKIDPADKLIDMSDYHYLEGMDYDASQLIDVSNSPTTTALQRRNCPGFSLDWPILLALWIPSLTWRPKTAPRTYGRIEQSLLPTRSGILQATSQLKPMSHNKAFFTDKMGLGDPTRPRPAAVTLAEIVERKSNLDASNAVFSIKKKHKLSNKDHDKQHETKSTDTSKDKPKAQQGQGLR
ncbi:hypothetical protein BGZ89_005172 [Linnemannia elongata]|nr:hypothetical protein BGZ89_005172 [Linnemannia elongata]